MPRASTTLDVDAEPRSDPPKREETELALVVAWCAHEPRRAGEVALLPQGTPPVVLGRGAAEDDDPRLRFFRLRAGALDPTPPLSSPTLSRRQLRLVTRRDEIHVEQIGGGALRINGARVTSGRIGAGDVLSLRRALVLYCTRRAGPGRRRALPFPLGPFGEPDACGILGESPAVVRLREQIAFAATVEAHVLVTGESGAGKELAAVAIHRSSSRAAGPIVARNAAALPPGLIDAELFGNIRNYPQAGMPERRGLIGEAHGGTLFLDEIGELPPELQAHLLRVLDADGEYHRLGEGTAQRSDFRLVAATNRQRAALKHDLAARLTVEVRVPSLADRREDIPLLARHLVLRLAERSPVAAARFVESTPHGPRARVTAALIEHLLRRDYRGNVRELEAVLLRAMSESQGDELDAPPEDAVAPTSRDPRSPGSARAIAEPRVERPAELTRDVVRAALDAAGGSVTEAARSLGMSRYALYRLLRKNGISSARRSSG